MAMGASGYTQSVRCFLERNILRAAGMCSLGCADVWNAYGKPASKIRAALRAELADEFDAYELTECTDFQPMKHGLATVRSK